jgi:hypothetical protein
LSKTSPQLLEWPLGRGNTSKLLTKIKPVKLSHFGLVRSIIFIHLKEMPTIEITSIEISAFTRKGSS